MLTQNNTNISAEALKATENALQEVIEVTAGLAGSFGLLEKVALDGACLLDTDTLSECRQMITTVNRLLCEQEGFLEHQTMMQSVSLHIDEEVLRLRSRSNLYNSLNS